MKLGSIATGPDFYDRKIECADLRRYLVDNNVVASGPRRLGKSSIVNRLREIAADEGLMAEHVDVQGKDSAQAFIDEVARHFPDESIKGYLAALGSQARTLLPAVKTARTKSTWWHRRWRRISGNSGKLKLVQVSRRTSSQIEQCTSPDFHR